MDYDRTMLSDGGHEYLLMQKTDNGTYYKNQMRGGGRWVFRVY